MDRHITNNMIPTMGIAVYRMRLFQMDNDEVLREVNMGGLPHRHKAALKEWAVRESELYLDEQRGTTMQKLIVMQGQPGSGKSTLALALSKETGAIICSTDDLFLDVDGKYQFDFTKLGVNHKRNQDIAVNLLKEGKSVIVDNTNIYGWQAKPYVEAAVALGIEVEFVRATGNFKTVHGVPDAKVEQMKRDMEVLTLESVLKSKAPF